MECGAAKSVGKILFQENFPTITLQSEIKHNLSDRVEHPAARHQVSLGFVILVYHILLTDRRTSVSLFWSEKKGYFRYQLGTNVKLSQGR
jgi:hypothetical protein